MAAVLTAALEQRIRALIQEFRTAYYGEDVRRTYADIAELVCIDAVKKADYATEQGDYAKAQGDYAKTQGNYAKNQGDQAKNRTDENLAAIRLAMQQIQIEFGDIKDTINDTENGSLLLEIKGLLSDMYRIATDQDIDNIIGGTYIDEEDEGSIFDAATDQDIDDIINGSYVDVPASEEVIEDPELRAIIDQSFE